MLGFILSMKSWHFLKMRINCFNGFHLILGFWYIKYLLEKMSFSILCTNSKDQQLIVIANHCASISDIGSNGDVFASNYDHF